MQTNVFETFESRDGRFTLGGYGVDFASSSEFSRIHVADSYRRPPRHCLARPSDAWLALWLHSYHPLTKAIANETRGNFISICVENPGQFTAVISFVHCKPDPHSIPDVSASLWNHRDLWQGAPTTGQKGTHIVRISRPLLVETTNGNAPRPDGIKTMLADGRRGFKIV